MKVLIADENENTRPDVWAEDPVSKWAPPIILAGMAMLVAWPIDAAILRVLGL